MALGRGAVSYERGTPVVRNPNERHRARHPEIGILLPNNQRQHRTLHIQKDVLPYALCYLLCSVLAALASIFWMDSISTSYTCHPHSGLRMIFSPDLGHLAFTLSVATPLFPSCNAYGGVYAAFRI